MRKSVKVSIAAIVVAIGLTACSPATGTEYSGSVTVAHTEKGKRSCKVFFHDEAGTEKFVYAESKSECWRIQEGSTVTLKNGVIQK